MKKCYSLTGIMGVLFLATTAQPDTGLIGQYSLSGNANNLSGNLSDGVISGTLGPAADRFGNAGCAFAFPGTATDIITIPDASDDFSAQGEFSVSLWYQGSSENLGDLERLLSKGAYEFYIGLYDLNRPLFGMGFGEAIWAPDSLQWGDDTWHHLVAVYNSGTCTFYADTVNVGSMEVALINEGADIIIGQDYQGNLDDIRIYNIELTAEEVAQLYLLESECSGTTSVNYLKEESSLEFYPNPASAEVVVKNKFAPDARLSVYDQTGRLVLSREFSQGELKISTKQLPNGIYSVIVTAGRYLQSGRLVVQH